VTRLRLTALLLAASAALAPLAAAQSLGELAEREKERRAKQPKAPAPAYGDADLSSRRGERPAGPASPGASPAPSPSADPTPAPSTSTEDENARRQLQAEWRTRFAEARERVSREEADSWRSVVDVVWHAGIPVQQLVRKFEEAEGLRQAKRALEDLEEEYRRTGLPPGWVR
jgi:hypothetical protein